jgi:preprotein translocase subunit Sec61beta
MHTKRIISPEYIVYICLWLVLFLMPVAIFYLRAKADARAVFR